MCEVSARDGEGIDGLIEGLLLQADVMELKASHAGQAEVRQFLSLSLNLDLSLNLNLNLSYILLLKESVWAVWNL